MTFQKEKKEFLTRIDKSRKGSVDKKIKSLIDKINSKEDFFTTSSCSGRVLILVPYKNNRKDKTKWLFSSHDKISFKNIKKALEKLPKKDVWFKAEAAILHVACKDKDEAIKFLNIARDSGFRRSGIISIRKNSFILEIVSTEKIETIISKNGKLIVGEDYIKILIKENNKKLENTWEKIKKLKSKIK